jgi:hypothetical protein
MAGGSTYKPSASGSGGTGSGGSGGGTTVDPGIVSDWVASTAVKQNKLVTVTVMGSVVVIRSNSDRTTGAVFDSAEAANWTVLSQNSVNPWSANTLVLNKLRVLIDNTEFQASSTRVTSGVLNDTEKAFFVKLAEADAPQTLTEWSNTVTYAVGDIVKKGRNLYVALTANTGSDPELDIEGPIPEVANDWRIVTAPSKLPLYYDVAGGLARQGFRAFISDVNLSNINIKSGRIAVYNYTNREFDITVMSTDMLGLNIYVNPTTLVESAPSNLNPAQYLNNNVVTTVTENYWTIHRVLVKKTQLNGARILIPTQIFSTKKEAIRAAETLSSLALENMFEVARIVADTGYVNWSSYDNYQIVHMSYQGEPIVSDSAPSAGYIPENVVLFNGVPLLFNGQYLFFT